MIAKPAHPSDEELSDRPAYGPHQPGANGHRSAARTLPHNLDAERGLLGCCFVDATEVLGKCHAARITADSFYDRQHAATFECMLGLAARGQPVEPATLYVELLHRPEFAGHNVAALLAQVSEATATTAQAAYFIEKVREQQVLREIIRAAALTAEDAYQFTSDLPALTADIRRRTEYALAGTVAGPTLAGRGLDAFSVPPDDDASVLLGNRYLNRGDGMILVSSSGMGKSSFSLQAAVCWALGRPFFGIRPNGPLRSLIVQSEDSDGDIAEVWASICHKMRLTDEERETVGRNVVIVTDRIHRGESFLAELKRQVTAERFDLVWINPLAAFVGGDATTAEASADFLRTGLNALNEPPTFGYVVVHHTTKPATGKDRSERRWHEVMYDMAGSYDIIGWARSIMSVRPTETMGEFNVVLAKRGRRAGVTKKIPQGVGYRLESTIIIPAKHCNETMRLPGLTRDIPVIFWEPREETLQPSEAPADKGGRPKQHSFADFITIFPVGPQAGLGFRPLHKIASELKPIGRGAFDAIITEAVLVGRLICDTSDPSRPRYYRPATDGLL